MNVIRKGRLLATLTIMSTALLGCATTPPSASQLKPVPADQIRQHKPVSHPNPATVRVVRDVGFSGAVFKRKLLVNGVEVAKLNPGEFFEFKVDPGEYALATLPDEPFGAFLPSTLMVTWRAGALYVYRSATDGNSQDALLPVTTP